MQADKWPANSPHVLSSSEDEYLMIFNMTFNTRRKKNIFLPVAG